MIQCTSDSSDFDRALSAHFRRDVRLARVAPDDFTIDQYHPDVEGADPGANRDKVVAQKLGSALFAELGMESPVPVGAFFDVFPLSVIINDLDARAADGASAPEPLRAAQVPHESDRHNRAAWFR